eukprot:CAMPEP_0184503444 /NCGR_PEP_ID=MMETSP0113_2-20130426/51824_1 /TAXON_ID=91329 /ORGANISM="Norrisiella sphaerica, Strain BC52" /LENGTH=172 /DNA_ID=CAMNT_0026892941 /DNA_START=1278 /DNA_END=1793 /DNA_ORIENTATION=+
MLYFPESVTNVGSRTLYGVDWSENGLISVASGDNAVRIFDGDRKETNIKEEKNKEKKKKRKELRRIDDDADAGDDANGSGRTSVAAAAVQDRNEQDQMEVEGVEGKEEEGEEEEEENNNGDLSTYTLAELPQLRLHAVRKRAHEQDVNTVRWNPKNPFVLASASDDFIVKIW